MRFCQPHWDALRAAIDAKGLTPLISQGGARVAERMVKELNENDTTIENFDPLMSAHWAIATNAMQFLEAAGLNPLYLLMNDDDPNTPAGRSTCPLCELNLLHRESCTDPRCQLDKEKGYDWMIEQAAKDAKEEADRRTRLAGSK